MADHKLKVFAIVPSAFCFGLQHVTIDFFKHFTNVNSLFLVSGWNNGDFIKHLDKHHLKYEISWLGMFSRNLAWYNLKMSLSALAKLPRLYYDFFSTLKTFKPDVLYFANHHELILLYPALKFVKTPVVCHMHDPSPAIPFQKKTFAFYSTVVDHFIAISDDVRQRTIDLGCDPSKTTTIHNGIEIPVETISTRKTDFINQFGWENNVFIVGITGQMTATKGHMDLLNAFRVAYSQNHQLRLVIGGHFIEPLYSELQATIKDWGLQNIVVFSGWQASVNSFFQNINLFVLASRHDEGYGLVVAEAMINGLPVVITHSGGAIEIVKDTVTGFIVPKRDIELMARKIALLSLNPVLCAEMGKQGRKQISERFDIARQAGILQTFLSKINKNAIRY
jgi:glycosyltransferase involved in cell wall biosynthesis